MKKILPVLLVVSASIVASAQSAWLSQTMFTRIMYNPGFAGMENSADIGYRSQWNQFPGEPITYTFNGTATLPCINSGIGLTGYQNALGFETQNEIKLSYSYHISLGTNILGIGASYGYNMLSVNGPWDVLPHSNTSDIGLGIFYNTIQGFYIGISTSKLIDQTLNFSGTEFRSDYSRYNYAMAGYVFHTPSDCNIITDAFIQSAYKNVNYQLNIRIQFSKLFWFGGGYLVGTSPYSKNYNGFTGLLGVMHEFNNKMAIRLAYSYDFPNSIVEGTGSNEIHVQYYIPTKPKETVK